MGFQRTKHIITKTVTENLMIEQVDEFHYLGYQLPHLKGKGIEN